MSPFHKFLEINQKICFKIENILPHTKPDITELYTTVVSEYANKKAGRIIVDIGGGRYTPFAKYLSPAKKHKLIVIDSLEKELRNNVDADQIIVADINKQLLLKPNSTDLIVSRYVLEHLDNLPSFLSHSQKILKDGGYSIHLFSGKFALFAIINQLLPDKLSNILLNHLIPGSKNIRGFHTSYNQCYYQAMMNNFQSHGFKIERVVINYYQSRYFSFLLPLYLISVVYELIIHTLGLKNLCAYLLIIAQKR